MKIALVHDYIKEYGGAERVLEALHEIYPQSDVFTTVYLPSYLGPHRKRFENWKIHTSFLQYIPLKQKLISPFRLLSPFAFRSFDFSDYDLVITSATGAYFPNTIQTTPHHFAKGEGPLPQGERGKRKVVHICYCHTPPRYLYGYATAREWKKNALLKALGEMANHLLRMVDFTASKNVDFYIANSEEVKARIEKFYRREATVIYPPVDTSRSSVISSQLSATSKSVDQFSVNKDRKTDKQEDRKLKTENRELTTEYYLAGGRLARPKHIDLIVKACTELSAPLKVFGKSFAGYGDELKEMAGDTVEFVGEVSDEEKLDLMRGAKAFIFASEDEDFGIVPVEAMAQGTPIIAYRSGGVKETVIDGKTGVFFDELTVERLKKAIKRFEGTRISEAECRKQAEKFSKERFQKNIQQLISHTIKEAQ